MDAYPYLGFGFSLTTCTLRPLSEPTQPCVSTMTTKTQQPEGRDGVLSSLNFAIDGLNLAKELSTITPAKAVFGSVGILLTTIKVRLLFFCDKMLQVHTWPGFDG